MNVDFKTALFLNELAQVADNVLKKSSDIGSLLDSVFLLVHNYDEK